MEPVFRVLPTIQTYDWGVRGPSSQVVQLATGSTLQDYWTWNGDTCYAELWMGTHPSSPSSVPPSNIALSEILRAHPELIGGQVINKFDASDGNLPFLFKVLSIEKALSIQTHPDKEAARRLHERSPNIYKDANHKPEMAIALTPFTALCGFLPLPKIAENLKSIPELSSLIPSDILSKFYEHASRWSPSTIATCDEKSILRSLFSAIMTASPEQVSVNLTALLARYSDGACVHETETEAYQLAKTLNTQFPNDVGVFCAFLFNYIKLVPGEAIFLGAGEPHAYISGDIIECMANSDNVIRAGLTPKLRDVPNLIANLTYRSGGRESHVIKGKPHRDRRGPSCSIIYDPPIAEFSVLRTELGGPAPRVSVHEGIDGPSLLLVVEGSGRVSWSQGRDGDTDEESERTLTLRKGDVCFVGAGWDLELCEEAGNKLVVYRAFVSGKDYNSSDGLDK